MFAKIAYKLSSVPLFKRRVCELQLMRVALLTIGFRVLGRTDSSSSLFAVPLNVLQALSAITTFFMTSKISSCDTETL